MAFNFFNLAALQEKIAAVDLNDITKSTQKNFQDFTKSLQPLTHKTQEIVASQLHQLQNLTNLDPGVEVSELPEDYLALEKRCDVLLRLYTDLIQFTNETYGKTAYDYPPGNNAIKKYNSLLGEKFAQLKAVSSPAELEDVLLGKSQPQDAHAQVVEVHNTLFGQLSHICSQHQQELAASESPVALALLQVASAYTEVAAARLEMDKTIINDVNLALVSVLNEQFIAVNELRKKVYSIRADFDQQRARLAADEENDELIAKEDELVSATEVAVIEMKKLLQPAKAVNLLTVLVTAQKHYFDAASAKLGAVLDALAQIKVDEE